MDPLSRTGRNNLEPFLRGFDGLWGSGVLRCAASEMSLGSSANTHPLPGSDINPTLKKKKSVQGQNHKLNVLEGSMDTQEVLMK